jgi:hypothetical protein
MQPQAEMATAPAGGPTVQTPSVTVVCCIESGVLEETTCRMVESLRRFGGRFSKAPVVAVTPRMGPPLQGSIRRRMRELGIEHLQIRPRHPYVWHHYVNKAYAVRAVEEQVRSEIITWVDSDILFLHEPNELELREGEGFTACAPDLGMLGSQGSTDPHDPFWERCANLLGLRLDDLPWLTTGDGHRVRFYWNAGLYSYRRSTGFGREFLSDFERALRERICRNHLQVHALDQVILGLTVLRMGLGWRAFPDTSNFPVLSWLPHNYDPEKVRNVDILHYHDSMQPHLWEKLLATLRPHHPKVHEWLSGLGPVQETPPLTRGLREVLRVYRGVKRRAYYAKCGFTKGSQGVA